MSGRIRTIKPELLEDAATAGLSSDAFRLFIATITLADDYGRLRAEPAWLSGQVFWKRPALEPVSELLLELEAARLIALYSVEGQRYAHIRSWDKHQKVDRPGKPRIPPPPEPSRESREDLARVSRESSETLATDLRPATTTSTPTETPNPTPSVRGFLGAEREWFAEAVRLATRNDRFVPPPAMKCGALLEVMRRSPECSTADNARAWLVTTVRRYAEDTEDERKVRPLTPDGWAKWIGEDPSHGRARPSRPHASEPVETDTVGIPMPDEVRAELAALGAIGQSLIRSAGQ